MSDVDLCRVPWRVGRRKLRTVYAVLAVDDPEGDVLIGLLDTPALAAAAVRGHNRTLGLDPLLSTPLERPEEEPDGPVPT